MPSPSVLYDGSRPLVHTGDLKVPASFADLNLERVVDAIVAGRHDHDLAPFFYASLDDVATVAYRQAAFRDLDGTPLLGQIRSFAEGMRSVRDHLAEAAKSGYAHQRERWLLDAAGIYCRAVSRLAHDLARADIRSRAFQEIRAYLSRYAASDEFTALARDAEDAAEAIGGITYCVLIKGNRVQVSRYDEQEDFSAQVAQTFERFAEGEAREHCTKLPGGHGMDQIEAHILALVAQLNPIPFARLHEFSDGHPDFVDGTIAVFDREVDFYVAYLDFVETFRTAGLPFCYPEVSDRSKEERVRQSYDLALAHQLLGEDAGVVCNDFELHGPERILVVTGPNQGGKTTFARMFGQVHHLASIGCPVPGAEAKLLLFDRLFTHFEKEEDLNTLAGKLQDDLIRIHEILEQASPRSVIVLNEIFTSTTLHDAVFLGTKVLERIIELDLLCVCVTFVDEWASLDEKTVSMVSTVEPDNPAVRTFEVSRRPANGLSYTAALVEKYGLTYQRLKERVGS